MSLKRGFSFRKSVRTSAKCLRLPDGQIHKSVKKIRPNNASDLELVSSELEIQNDQQYFIISKVQGENFLLPLFYPRSSNHLHHDTTKFYLLFHLSNQCVSKCVQMENPRDVQDIKLINDVGVANRNGLQMNPDDTLIAKNLLDSSESVNRLLAALLSSSQLTTEIVPVKDPKGTQFELGVNCDGLKLRPKFDQCDVEQIPWCQLGSARVKKACVLIPFDAPLVETTLLNSFVVEQRGRGRASRTKSASRRSVSADRSKSKSASTVDLIFVLSDAAAAKQLAHRLCAVRSYAVGESSFDVDRKSQISRSGAFARLNERARASFRRISRSISKKRKPDKDRPASEDLEPAPVISESDCSPFPMTISSKNAAVVTTSHTEATLKLTGPGVSPNSISPVKPADSLFIPITHVVAPTAAGEAEAELDEHLLQTLDSQSSSLIGPPIPSATGMQIGSSVPLVIKPVEASPTKTVYAMGIKPTIISPVSVQPSSTYAALPRCTVSPKSSTIPTSVTCAPSSTTTPQLSLSSTEHRVSGEAFALGAQGDTRSDILVTSDPAPKVVLPQRVPFAVPVSSATAPKDYVRSVHSADGLVNPQVLIDIADVVARRETPSNSDVNATLTAFTERVSHSLSSPKTKKIVDAAPPQVSSVRASDVSPGGSTGLYEPLPLDRAPLNVTNATAAYQGGDNVINITIAEPVVDSSPVSRSCFDTPPKPGKTTSDIGPVGEKQRPVLKDAYQPATLTSFQSGIRAPSIGIDRPLTSDMDVFARSPEFPVPYTPRYAVTNDQVSGLQPPKVIPNLKAPSSPTDHNGNIEHVTTHRDCRQSSGLPSDHEASSSSCSSVSDDSRLSSVKPSASSHPVADTTRAGSCTPPTPTRSASIAPPPGSRTSLSSAASSSTGIKLPQVQPGFIHDGHLSSSSRHTGILPPSQIRPSSNPIRHSELVVGSTRTAAGNIKLANSPTSGIKPPNSLFRSTPNPSPSTSPVSSSVNSASLSTNRNGLAHEAASSKSSALPGNPVPVTNIPSGLRPPSRVPRANQA